MIGIIDYGLGNVQAFATMYKRLGIPAAPVRNEDEIAKCDKLILPGVGAFDHAIKLFTESGMRDAVVERVTTGGTPLLGVCVGMQMLAKGSAEGELPGLGLVRGRVEALSALPEAQDLPLPHMGWNDVATRKCARLFAALEDAPRFYFLHSFYFSCSRETDVAATVEYGERFCCAVEQDNVFGVQFHPEKSHHFGAALLRSFAEI
jgi:imidazole glycerol-phosphate synthase subunit HisH